MWSKQSAVVSLLLPKVRPEQAAMLLKQAARPATAACCEQIVWFSEREVVSIQQQDLVEGGDIRQDKGLELEGEALQVEGEMVPGIGNLPGI